MKNTFENTCLIEIKVGDLVTSKKDGLTGIIKDIKIVPNDKSTGSLIAQLFVYIASKDKVVCSTSDKWVPHNSSIYDVMYPSVHLHAITEQVIKEAQEEDDTKENT